MTPRQILTFSVFGAAMLGGCDREIAGTRIESILAVSETPTLFDGAKPGYGNYIQIDISAPEEWIHAVNEADGVYSEVGYCPLEPHSTLLAIGPYGTNGTDLSLGSDWPDVPDDSGRIHFRVFLIPGHPMLNTKYAPSFDQKPYDLRTNQQDVCLRITAPGFDKALTTNTIRIPANTLAKAAQSEASPAQALGATRR